MYGRGQNSRQREPLINESLALMYKGRRVLHYYNYLVHTLEKVVFLVTNRDHTPAARVQIYCFTRHYLDERNTKVKKRVKLHMCIIFFNIKLVMKYFN